MTTHPPLSSLSPHSSMRPLKRTRKPVSHLTSRQSSSTDISDHPSYLPSGTSPIQADLPSEVHKIGERKKGSSGIQGKGRKSPHVTICSLPDNVLLDIFEFCLPDPGELRARTWPMLVHVCQSWRYIVFASPLRLDLRLLCKNRTPVRKMLDIWPPLQIQIQSFYVGPQHGDDIIAALEHPNRVRSISLGRIQIPLERLVAVMQEPFPELESLSLQMYRPGKTVPALPNTFLGGSAPRLRSLDLRHISFPTLPRLLLSSNDLVDLTLYWIPQNGYISPEAMATCVSALTSLTKLSIGFKSPTSRPDPITRPSPPLTRAVLPALIDFCFRGVSEYLEDLVAQIDAPLLHTVRITFSNQLVFDIPQLSRFIHHAPALMSYNTANIDTYANNVVMTFSSMSITGVLIFDISCGVDWQISSVAQICNQLPFIQSSITRLKLNVSGLMSQVEMDDERWLDLFQPFIAVQTLQILDAQSLVVSALRGLSGELAMQVLPALEKLHVSERHEHQYWMWPFVIARQHSDHPVVVLRGGM
ncbi:hypothetical protein BGW80DRAFT_445628 [Lactifluus volemus]|nr:hypothetical protein BGW80DRAFT_445628 [Lactifluus volemus]